LFSEAERWFRYSDEHAEPLHGDGELIQYDMGLKRQIILRKILLKFTYEAVVEPIHKQLCGQSKPSCLKGRRLEVTCIFALEKEVSLLCE
jgi:hypothetical protein